MQSGYIELPDGRYEFSPAIPEDVLLTPIFFPFVSTNPGHQNLYESFRLSGEHHDASVTLSSHLAARKSTDDGFRIPDIMKGASDLFGQPFWVQYRYWVMRRRGISHDESFSRMAREASRRDAQGKLIGYEDDEIMTFSAGQDFPTVSKNFDAQVAYWRMRNRGESHNMAEMLATRSFPGVKTDAIFNEAKFSSDSGLIGVQQKWLRQQAESAGVSTNGKWYCSGLASFPGDPTAWVGDRGDVLRIAREKNMTVHGYVEHQAVKDLSDSANLADAPIAQDVIDDGVEDYLEAHPFAPIEEATEAVLRTRGGHEDYNPLLVKDYGDEVFSDD